MTEDLSSIASAVLSLIKAQQIEKAAQLVQKAHRSALTKSFQERQQTVHEVTLALVEARKQRQKLIQAVNEFPQGQQLLVRAQVEKICRDLFDAKIIELQTRKRQLSRTRS